MSDTIKLNSRIPEFVIYPRDGHIASGVRFVTNVHQLCTPTTADIGSLVKKAEILHTWWRSLTLEECKRMHNDGITLDRVIERMDVLQLGKQAPT